MLSTHRNLTAILLLSSLTLTGPILHAQDAARSYQKVPHGSEWREMILKSGKEHAKRYGEVLDKFRAQLLALQKSRAAELKVPASQVRLTIQDLEKLDSWNVALAAQYYDAGATFYRNAILEPSQAPFWNEIGDRTVEFYRDWYVVPSGGNVPGFRLFSDGLMLHYQRMKNLGANQDSAQGKTALTAMTASREAIISLSKNAAFVRDATPEDTTDPILSREVAYAIRTLLHAELLGEPRRARLTTLVDHALQHLQALLPDRLPKQSDQLPYTRPFMVAITARALIDYHDVTQDPRIRPALRKAAEHLWTRMWDENRHSFLYSNRKFQPHAAEEDLNPAPDLNLMIAPLFAWLSLDKKESIWRERADQILIGGLRYSYWDGDKQYNQNGWWSFHGIGYRAGIPRVESLQPPAKK